MRGTTSVSAITYIMFDVELLEWKHLVKKEKLKRPVVDFHQSLQSYGDN